MVKTKKPVSRRLKKRSVRESLAWFKEQWSMAAGKDALPDAVLAGLAQLSYENKQLRSRVASVEAVLVAQMFGKVEIRGVLHLLECGKRQDAKGPCTCGSLPDEARTTGRGN
jgi:hypothetical protein